MTDSRSCLAVHLANPDRLLGQTLSTTHELSQPLEFMIENWMTMDEWYPAFSSHALPASSRHEDSIATLLDPTATSASPASTTPSSVTYQQDPHPQRTQPEKVQQQQLHRPEHHHQHQQQQQQQQASSPTATGVTTTAISQSAGAAVADYASLALFPEITHGPAPRAIRVKKIAPRPIPIVPKTISRATSGALFKSTTSSSSHNKKNDPDAIARKRQKNTDAARRSRLKKVMKMEALKNHLATLEEDNARLTDRVTALEEQKSLYEVKHQSMEEKILILERQLMDAQHGLIQLNDIPLP